MGNSSDTGNTEPPATEEKGEGADGAGAEGADGAGAEGSVHPRHHHAADQARGGGGEAAQGPADLGLIACSGAAGARRPPPSELGIRPDLHFALP